MSRRIDVELTSDKGDGTWTWRAAGARQPRGELDGSLLPPGAKVGDVLKVDADIGLDGITITEVIPPKGPRPEPERLEIIAKPPPPDTPWEEPRPRRGDRDRRPREGRPPGRPRDTDRARPPRRDRDSERGGGAKSGGREEGEERRRERPRPAPPPPRPKPKKLRPGRTHRKELLEQLQPAQQPIAEQLLRGGMAAVRTALNEQNTNARKEGKPEAPVQAVLTIAENLLPQVRRAEWLDRAEAAAADVGEIALHDLRSVVVSADDLARDDETRALAARLREELERRSAAESEEWLAGVRQALDDGRVVRALRIASRAPEPNASLPDELSSRLVDAAGAALAADVAPDRWAAVLDALAWSPVRSAVKPSGVPAEPTEELLVAVRKHAGRMPEIAGLFGVEAPAPKGKRAGRRRDKRRTEPRSDAPSAGPAGPDLAAAPEPAPSEGPPPALEAPAEPEPVADAQMRVSAPVESTEAGTGVAATSEAPPAPEATPAPAEAPLPAGIRRITPAAVSRDEPTAPTADTPSPHGDPLADGLPDAATEEVGNGRAAEGAGSESDTADSSN